MSKRCCAKNCFSSILYNKNITYFSFPKNKEFADRWADLSGRSDLKEKPLNRIIKYYLCSEHFASNCFVDADTRKILKRNLPHSIALPSIFKNNLQETMQIANPKQSIEVHNIVLLGLDDGTSLNADLSSENVQNPLNFESGLNLSSSNINNESEQQLDGDPGESVDEMEEEILLECFDMEKISVVTLCRFCSNEITESEDALHFEESPQIKKFIERVMSKQQMSLRDLKRVDESWKVIKKINLGDNMSQVSCKNCESKAIFCLTIIQQMDEVQEKIKGSLILTEDSTQGEPRFIE